MERHPNGYWTNRNNRINAIKKLLTKVNKKPSEFTNKDFLDHGLRALLRYYNDSGYLALKEIYPNLKKTDMNMVSMGYWTNRENRIKEIKKFVKRIKKPLSQITKKDLNVNKLSTILNRYYNGSPYLLLRDAGYDHKLIESEYVTKHYWEYKLNRIKHIKELLEKIKKRPNQITQQDFIKNGLASMLNDYYSGSPFLALKEIYPKLKETDMKMVPMRYWNNKRNRVKALKQFFSSLNKPPELFEVNDLKKAGLITLHCYYSSKIDMLTDAGIKFDIMNTNIVPMGFWKNRNNRIKYIRYYFDKLNKPIERIIVKDFNGRIRKVIFHHYKTFADALIDAGYKFNIVEMKSVPNKYWHDKEHRILAIKSLVINLNKDLILITIRDFLKNNLGGLLQAYYKNSPFMALKEAGYILDEKEYYKRKVYGGGSLRHKSDHGHLFRSVFEKEGDDFLYFIGLKLHKHNVIYPGQSKRYNCDFVTLDNNYWIEFAGLIGKEHYDKRILIKRKIVKKAIKKGLIKEWIIITFDDFYKNRKRLYKKLSNLLKEYNLNQKVLNDYI